MVVTTDILHVIVEDNGIGIQDQDKEKIFTPFFTTKLSSKKGTGLGLVCHSAFD
jgi:signal transduction histidine kinase